jgi:hypothetical protein
VKLFALILIAVVIPGGSLALAAYLRRRWLDRQDAKIVIPPFVQIYTGHDEKLEMRSRVRREIVDQAKRRSAAIASGSSSASVLKIARKA